MLFYQTETFFERKDDENDNRDFWYERVWKKHGWKVSRI